ncbi:hypothetical protein [Microbacterium testaceum]|nr:hypothetical protein [Microbacterium testaceum]
MAPPSRPRRRRLVLPLTLAVIALSTGAALAAPIWLGVGEDATRVDPDAQIPITYTTLSGVKVDCVWAVRVGEDQRSAADDRVARALAQTDWEGIGQEIYDYAIANPRGPQPGEVWTNDTPEVRDALAFRIAVTPIIERRLPAEIRALEPGWASTSTCTGPFR